MDSRVAEEGISTGEIRGLFQARLRKEGGFFCSSAEPVHHTIFMAEK